MCCDSDVVVEYVRGLFFEMQSSVTQYFETLYVRCKHLAHHWCRKNCKGTKWTNHLRGIFKCCL